MVAGRDESGRFTKGISGNPKGRAPKEREQAYQNVLLTTVSMAEWEKIIRRAVDDAKNGDSAARKWLSDYLVGLPRQGIDMNMSGELLLLDMPWESEGKQS